MRLDGVECRTEGRQVVARVRLSLDDDVRTGSSSAPAVGTGWQRAVAEATLQAVAAFVGGGVAFTLDSVTEIRTGRHPLIVVTIVVHDGRREVFLSGASRIKDHPPTAVARAVLHGLNRWTEFLHERDITADPLADHSGSAIH
ncbi:MAG: hypothetical protein QN141_02290 [Armatimonadota bacterium]|nr:hypothetical protein [Armatimonadota bacterium]MDR7450730.1 hypothetical protein [Armatimonadota bacterium]MDR7466086.1 hypothetical protein [Armatimonadota bacterium]MDR7493877.1 hypothetical protein [Armatimonadota bacterium]MDR7498962.1 hypothetical protein [Armatimonadota bacterium]